jgi:hypothetical protein
MGLPNNQVKDDPRPPLNCQQNKRLIVGDGSRGKSERQTNDLPSESFDQHDLGQGVKTHTERPGGWILLLYLCSTALSAVELTPKSRRREWRVRR